MRVLNLENRMSSCVVMGWVVNDDMEVEYTALEIIEYVSDEPEGPITHVVLAFRDMNKHKLPWKVFPLNRVFFSEGPRWT